jgi:hypothetical protein
MAVLELMGKIRDLNDNERRQFALIARNFQMEQKHRLKRANDFELQISNFAKGKLDKVSIDNLESYFYAIGVIESKRSASYQSVIKWKSSWKDIILELVEEMDIPIDINMGHINKDNKEILQRLMKNILICTAEEETLGNKLTLFDSFVSEIIMQYHQP